MRVRYLGGISPYPNPSGASPTRLYPQFTRDQWVEFYWRVRTFKAAMVIDPGFTLTSPFIFDNIWTETPPAGPTDENDVPLYYTTSVKLWNAPDESYFAELTIDARPVYESSGDLYIPRVRVDIQIPDESGYFSDSDVTTTPADHTEMDFSMTLMGLPCENFYRPTVNSDFTGSITIAAADPGQSPYWENRKADNTAPIYDDDDGSELIDPHQTDELP